MGMGQRGYVFGDLVLFWGMGLGNGHAWLFSERMPHWVWGIDILERGVGSDACVFRKRITA
jgi:hypothetical protein